MMLAKIFPRTKVRNPSVIRIYRASMARSTRGDEGAMASDKQRSKDAHATHVGFCKVHEKGGETDIEVGQWFR